MTFEELLQTYTDYFVQLKPSKAPRDEIYKLLSMFLAEAREASDKPKRQYSNRA